MQSYICMLCKRNDLDCISICYKNGRASVKDDMFELYGNAIEQHLRTDDQVCVNCVQVLDNVVRLKNQLYEIIVDYAVSRKIWGKPGTKVFNLSKVWNLRLTNTASSYSSYDGPTEAVSPSDLLMITGSIPYDQRPDTDMEIANNKYRSYDRDTPILDREVQEMTSRHRRRAKGHNWTRRKGSQRSRDRSRVSQTTSGTYSRTSRTSAGSRASTLTTSSKKQQLQKKSEQSQIKRILSDLLYQNDSLSQFARVYLGKCVDRLDLAHYYGSEKWSRTVNGKTIVKTRFASEIRDKLLSEYERCVYECPDNSCHEALHSLEAITEHRVKKHNEMALFLCEQCKFSYLSQEHLDKHKEIHYGTFIQYCIYCSEEYTNKKLYEEHLDEHLIHSFPCIYCDKFFLRKQLCEKHIREQHPGRKKKIKRIKPQSILDRIDKDPESNEPNGRQSTNSHKQSEEFVVRVLWQHGRPEDSNIPPEDEPCNSPEGDLEDEVVSNLDEELRPTQESEMISASSN